MTNSLKRDLEPPRPRQPRDKVHIWGFACRRCGWHTTKWRGQTVVAQKVYFLCDYCARRNEAEFPDDKNHRNAAREPSPSGDGVVTTRFF